MWMYVKKEENSASNVAHVNDGRGAEYCSQYE